MVLRCLFCALLALLLTAGLVTLLAAQAPPQQETMVTVHPAAASLPMGALITVELWAEDVANLYAADVQFRFDTARLELRDDAPAIPGVQITPRRDLLSPDLVLHREGDNQAGTIWYVVTQVSPSEPVSGSGALCQFTFHAERPGLAPVSVYTYRLVTRDGEVIPAGSAGALYTVEGSVLFLPLILAGP